MNNNSNQSKEMFLEHLYSIFQIEPEIFKRESNSEDLYSVYAFVYKDIPEKNYTTIISYGLSLIDYPSWKQGRPELMLTVESVNNEWINSFLDCIYYLKNVFSFSYGQIIKFDDSLASDTEMSAFFVFAPSIIDPEFYLNIDIKQNYKIALSALYPIYKNEIKTIENIGLQEFMYNGNYDMYSVQRTEIVD